MNEEGIENMIKEIEESGYIDCSTSSDYTDDKQFEKILAALNENISLKKKLENVEAENMQLRLSVECIEKRIRHLFKSKTIRMYDEKKRLKPDVYLKDINELDAFIQLANIQLHDYFVKNRNVNRLLDFDIKRSKNDDIEMVYNPIKKSIELSVTLVENVDDELCPICKNELGQYPALSRKDNKTKICSKCGMNEALEMWYINEKNN